MAKHHKKSNSPGRGQQNEARDKKQHRKGQESSRFSGTIHIASNNVGYVTVEGVEQDVQIQTQFLNTALHGDEVEIALLPKNIHDTRMQGEVVRVLERAKTEFIGTVDKKDPKKNFAFVIPDDSRMQSDIFIPDARSKEIKDNYKVVVKITNWGGAKKNLSGEITQILGEKGDNNVEMQSILLESGYQPGFTKEVVKEAQDLQRAAKPIPSAEIESRRDLRSTPTFTIDPSDAKDLDDALSVKKLNDNLFEIGVHIADVSHYVQEDSPLDMQARQKGTSVYLVDRTSPMLPEELSSDICSLNPGEDKLAFSVVMKMTSDGRVTEKWFGKTVIHPDTRFSYEEAQQVIDKNEGKHANELYHLDAISRKLQEQRKQRGALEFDQVEIQFELDSSGKPIRIYKKAELHTHKLIEEFMILANREVAGYFKEQIKKGNGFGVFRNHDAPEHKNIDDLFNFLGALGYDLETPTKALTTKELNNLFAAVKGKNEEYLVETVAMRGMEKAVYSTENKGHYGLALDTYTHFTSPIRRYADLTVHRLLQKYLEGRPVPKKAEIKYKKILDGLLHKEIGAMEAERNSIKYKQIEYMLEKKGQVFEGIVISIFNWGMFIQENTTKSEGLVRTRDMQDDFYELDEQNYALIGVRTKKKYTIGDTVKIKVTGGDIDQKMLDYKIV